jgi:hypothetical protein
MLDIVNAGICLGKMHSVFPDIGVLIFCSGKMHWVFPNIGVLIFCSGQMHWVFLDIKVLICCSEKMHWLFSDIGVPICSSGKTHWLFPVSYQLYPLNIHHQRWENVQTVQMLVQTHFRITTTVMMCCELVNGLIFFFLFNPFNGRLCQEVTRPYRISEGNI